MKVTISIRAVPEILKKDRIYYTTFTNYYECNFEDLVRMLQKDFIYSPFNFIGYQRNNQNICGTANFAIFDIDYTSISIQSCAELLEKESLNYIIATTSNKEDLYRYRVLLPLNKEVSPEEYRALIFGVKHHALLPDIDLSASAKPAGVFYSYAGSLVLFNFTESPLVVEDYLVDLKLPEYRTTSPTADISQILHEFDSYQYAIKGKRTKSLLSAAYTAIDMGLSYEQVEQVVNYVNTLFLIPKSHADVKRRVLNFIKQRSTT